MRRPQNYWRDELERIMPTDKTLRELAEDYGVTTTHMHRVLAYWGYEPGDWRKTRGDVDWANVDWTLRDWQIIRRTGKTHVHVNKMRKKHAPPHLKTSVKNRAR